MTFVGIDPSVRNIGFARLVDNKLATTTLKVKPDADRIVQLKRACLAIKVALDIHVKGPFTIVSEYPTFQNSMRGKIAATSGDTLGLAAICGYLIGIQSQVILPTPMEWKGTVPKEITGYRFTEWTGKDFNDLTDHEVDAAMMIQWVQATLTHSGDSPHVSWQPL